MASGRQVIANSGEHHCTEINTGEVENWVNWNIKEGRKKCYKENRVGYVVVPKWIFKCDVIKALSKRICTGYAMSFFELILPLLFPLYTHGDGHRKTCRALALTVQ